VNNLLCDKPFSLSLFHPHLFSGVDFTNIFRTAFCYSVLKAFLNLQFGFAVFWQKNLSAKDAVDVGQIISC